LVYWRLIIGLLLLAFFTGLCWLDAQSIRPGLYLLPLAILMVLLATQELLRLYHVRGHDPLAWTNYGGATLVVLAACAPIVMAPMTEDSILSVSALTNVGWLMGGVAIALIVAFLGELVRYRQPGTTITNLSLTALTILYLAGMLGFLVQLRLLPVQGNVQQGGMLAMASLVAVVKLTDVGAYFTGKNWGRHKFSPVLSPGKTWEGVAGGVLLAIGGACFFLGPVASWLNLTSQVTWSRWIGGTLLFGLAVSGVSIMGDLAESLLKRDAGVKDSSTWLPGFGGVLDLLDSLLLTAPVGYILWATGLVQV